MGKKKTAVLMHLKQAFSAYLRKNHSKILYNSQEQKQPALNEMYTEYFIHWLKEETVSNKIFKAT